MVACLREAHCITGRGYRLWSSRHEAIVTGVLIATLAFSTLLNPPGGVHQDGPLAGKAILRTHPFFPAFFTHFTCHCFHTVHIGGLHQAHASVGCLRNTTDFVHTCILMNYVTAAWMLCFSGSKKTALLVTLSIVLGAVTAIITSYLLRKQRIRRKFNIEQFVWTVRLQLSVSTFQIGLHNESSQFEHSSKLHLFIND
ncbi:hypothetical protein EJ110_NYTH21751 [Nymphaea thermarum]|nr:hypothetical protein EJ110_NYTH21751 [Nymphaea thermarum]